MDRIIHFSNNYLLLNWRPKAFNTFRQYFGDKIVFVTIISCSMICELNNWDDLLPLKLHFILISDC